MKYNKGDTIEIDNGRIVLVLNDGLPGKKFVAQYEGQVISYFSSFIKRVRKTMVGETFSRQLTTTTEEVWYYVMVGDQIGWIEERRFYLAHRGRYKRK